MTRTGKHIAAALLVLGALPAQAEVRRPAGGAASAQVQALLQQISAERDTLKADNTRLKADLDKAQQAQKTAETAATAGADEATRLRAALAAFQTQNEALRAQLGQSQTAFGSLRSEHAATQAELKQAQGKGQALDGELGECRARVDTLIGHNRRLFDIGNELLDRFEKKGVWASLREAEPFTGLKRVELENIVQDYRFAIDDQRVAAPAAPGADADVAQGPDAKAAQGVAAAAQGTAPPQ
jgi:chromosome segregation ATPase